MKERGRRRHLVSTKTFAIDFGQWGGVFSPAASGRATAPRRAGTQGTQGLSHLDLGCTEREEPLSPMACRRFSYTSVGFSRQAGRTQRSEGSCGRTRVTASGQPPGSMAIGLHGDAPVPSIMSGGPATSRQTTGQPARTAWATDWGALSCMLGYEHVGLLESPPDLLARPVPVWCTCPPDPSGARTAGSATQPAHCRIGPTASHEGAQKAREPPEVGLSREPIAQRRLRVGTICGLGGRCPS